MNYFKSARLFRGGGVVVDDLPAVGKFAEDQRKAAVGSFAIGHGQMPRAADERGFGAEDFDTKIGEIELAHFVAGAVIGGTVAVERGLPTA